MHVYELSSKVPRVYVKKYGMLQITVLLLIKFRAKSPCPDLSKFASVKVISQKTIIQLEAQ